MGGTGSVVLPKKPLPILPRGGGGGKARCTWLRAGLPHLLNQLRLHTANSGPAVEVSFVTGGTEQSFIRQAWVGHLSLLTYKIWILRPILEGSREEGRAPLPEPVSPTPMRVWRAETQVYC